MRVIAYTVNAPVPVSPRLSLAPDDYQTRQRVWIRYTGEDADSVVIYYTIDGQSPTSNSPIYTGEPFWLPGGRVHVKAVAVNVYGKVSNEMDVEVIIHIDFKRYFNKNDTFSDLVVLSTTRTQFEKKFGEPLREEAVESALAPSCVCLYYDWGYACFAATSSSGYVLYEFQSNQASFRGPRYSKVGMTESEITALFRDMGQADDQNGDRSIYWDQSEGYAKRYKLDASHSRIDYVYYTNDDGSVILSYYLTNQVVTDIAFRYQP